MTCQTVLIQTNIRWLRQALDLLDRIDDAVYATTPRGMAPHRAGGHLRHIIEFYQAFLQGIESSYIDYDARGRVLAVERSRAAASATIQDIIRKLESLPPSDGALWIRMEDAPADVPVASMRSTICRELQVLSSHTIHHFALIGMTLRLHGVEMDPDFGMAPSTLRYIASRNAEAA